MIMEILRLTPKFSQRTQPIKRIIVHDTAGLMDGCLVWLQTLPPTGSSNSSVHILVDKEGNVYRMVSDTSVAWHCRGYNEDSLGIELERATEDETGDYTPRQLYAAAEVIGSWCSRYRIPLNRIYSHAELDPERRRDPRNFDWYSFLLETASYINK